MQLNELYARFSDQIFRLFKDMGSPQQNLMHAAAGIAGEAGEFMDAIKKYWAYGKPLDTENCKEELGDLLFYIEAACQELNIDFEDLMQANIDKLSKRYASGTYSDQQAISRADKEA